MIARFIGGHLDGKERDDVAGDRYFHFVPVLESMTAHEFGVVHMGSNGMPMRRIPKHEVHVYKATKSEPPATVVYELERIEVHQARMVER